MADDYDPDVDAPPLADQGPDMGDDTGEEVPAELQVAKALGVTEPPSQKTSILLDQHPEIWPDYEEKVLEKLVIRDAYPPTAEKDGSHKTYPFLTQYERTKVLALRASQLAHGAPAFIDVPEYLTDVYEVAKAELEAKRLPYIIKRPLPNGEFEYWRLADLMLL